MLEDASLESSSAVLDSQQGSASVDRKRKATDEGATLSSAHSKVMTNQVTTSCNAFCLSLNFILITLFP